jgi:hypothetical protein
VNGCCRTRLRTGQQEARQRAGQDRSSGGGLLRCGLRLRVATGVPPIGCRALADFCVLSSETINCACITWISPAYHALWVFWVNGGCDGGRAGVLPVRPAHRALWRDARADAAGQAASAGGAAARCRTGSFASMRWPRHCGATPRRHRRQTRCGSTSNDYETRWERPDGPGSAVSRRATRCRSVPASSMSAGWRSTWKRRAGRHEMGLGPGRQTRQVLPCCSGRVRRSRT